jgi:catechol 2,3-dioxygenase-like lactoylglutathione lyase family enzyme
MLKRIDHVGVIVDSLEEAKRFLSSLGMEFDRDLELPDRLRASFYRCGEVQVEVIEITEPIERMQRLGGDRARVEHIALEVDDLAATLQAFGALGVEVSTAQPVEVGNTLNLWTVPETCDGVMYQLIQKGGVGNRFAKTP